MRGDAYSLMLRYREFAHAPGAPSEWAPPLSPAELPGLQVLHSLWAAGLPDCSGTCNTGCRVRLLDPGTWNRADGPDFLDAEVEMDGVRRRGAVEVHLCPEDWEAEGCMRSEAYNGVILHVAACAPRNTWATLNARREEIPLLVLPAERVRRALDLPFRSSIAREQESPLPLATMSGESVLLLLQAAAAYRMHRKRRRFVARSEAVGERQARYEAWAETLGYSANKQAMGLLAARAPLVEARENPEAILFGTAGFLVPMLPERAVPEARAYHAGIWKAWWPLRDRFDLRGKRALPWAFTGQRPQNHPHRRVAALAATAAVWPTMEALLKAEHLKELFSWLGSLHHPYWSRFVSLPSAPGRRETALVGRERALDFAVNHILPNDDGENAWKIFLCMHAGAAPTPIAGIAASLWGERADLAALLRLVCVQQGLLQLRQDFGIATREHKLLFVPVLAEWGKQNRGV